MNALIALLSRFFSRKPQSRPYAQFTLVKGADGLNILPTWDEWDEAFATLALATVCIPFDGYIARNEMLLHRNKRKIHLQKRKKAKRKRVKASRKRNR